MNDVSVIEGHIRTLVEVVAADETFFGFLSTGERLAVALVLDCPDLVRGWGTMLEAIDRLGPEWTRAALRVQRDGWDTQR